MKSGALWLVCAIAMSWLAGSAYADSIGVNTGFLASGSSPDGNFLSVRMRNLDNSADQQEVYLGTPDLGVAGNRVGGFSGAAYGASNEFTLEWDPLADLLTFTLDNGTVTNTLNYTSTYAGDLNYLQFFVSEAATSSTVTGEIRLINLVLNGVDVTGIPDPTPTGGNNYYLSGINLTSGFTLTGVLERTGVFGSSAEGAGRVDITAGYRASEGLPTTPFGPAIVPVPAAAWMGLLGIGMVAVRRRLKKS